MSKNKIKYGKVDLLPPGEFDPKKAKVRISIVLEGDLLLAYKEAAKQTPHGEYQTLMKEKLREGLKVTSQKGSPLSEAVKTAIRRSVKNEIRGVIKNSGDAEIKKAMKNAGFGKGFPMIGITRPARAHRVTAKRKKVA